MSEEEKIGEESVKRGEEGGDREKRRGEKTQ